MEKQLKDSDIENKIIWLFREPRSGSTTACAVITDTLNRQYRFIDNPPEIYKQTSVFYQEENDNKVVYNTHFFPALASMKNYTDPMLIRISRRNVVEQCLSFLACKLMDWKFFNLSSHKYQIDDNRQIFEEFCQSKIELKKEQVDFFARHRKRQNHYWNTYALEHDHQVIYYEDMDEPIDIPILGLYNLNLTTNTIKLPDYKKQVFTNCDAVEEWLSVYENL